MDYDATDRDMSSWVVSCVNRTTRFYLNDDGLATDIPANAERYRWNDLAAAAAKAARDEPAWTGYDWQPFRVAAMMAL